MKPAAKTGPPAASREMNAMESGASDAPPRFVRRIAVYMLKCIRITIGGPMARVTINLPDELHRALKAAAARRGTTIGSMVAESLEAYGIKSRSEAALLVERARRRSGLTEDDALALAVDETAGHRSP